jgi:transposase
MLSGMDKTLFPIGDSTAPEQRSEVKGEPRLVRPNRAQIELRPLDLESLVPMDHPVRAIWDFVESLDLTALHLQVQAVEGSAGRPAIDPRIYMALWLYATVEGVGSARALERLTEQHDVYRWICGGVGVNYHSLSDFRVQHESFLDALLTKSVASLMARGVVTLKRVAQDGLRVRTSAGSGSFRSKPKLTKCLREAEEQVQRLRQELEEDPQATHRRQAAAQQRAAEERHRRVSEALEQMKLLESKREQQKKRKKHKERALRASLTDPEARVMKMADGGFRPAYNAQLCVDVATQVVVGVDLTNSGSDRDQLVPMLEQLGKRYRITPAEVLVDGGYAGLRDVKGATQRGATVYAPLPKPKDRQRDPHVPLRGDSPAVAEWRQRMGTDQAKQIYKQRASSVECVNAAARQRGLQQFRVRGKSKTRAILLWHALVHNLFRSLSLGVGPLLTAT